jgi:resuscitation-promoting factor RpfA
MAETNTRIRLATTAIAAVLAISSTPLLAQDATAPDTPVETTATPSADPLAPEPAADVTAAPETPPAAETTATSSATATTRPTATRRATTTARTTRQSAAAAAPVAAPAAATPAATAGPAPLPAEPAPVAEAAPPVPAEPSAAREMQANTVLPMLGAAAVALLALLTAVVLMLRRRRRRLREEADDIAYYDEAESPVAAELPPEPAFVPAAVAAPSPVHDPIFDNRPASAPTTALPAGFDLSRFGPHTQAAYRGPTPDNPSLSLKYRLSKAAALDQRERAMQAAGADAPTPAAAVTTRVETAPGSSDFMLRTNGTKATVRRAYSE